MLETVRKPNSFYVGSGNYIMGSDKNIYSYYWTAYSRSTDGFGIEVNSSNVNLNGYKQQQTKSLFDPCPYGFRLPTNGTFNKFSFTSLPWLTYNYTGGGIWSCNSKSTWANVTGYRNADAGLLQSSGAQSGYRTSSVGSLTSGYVTEYTKTIILFNNSVRLNWAWPVRCIEDAKKEVADY